jgi:hypothetical protein
LRLGDVIGAVSPPRREFASPIVSRIVFAAKRSLWSLDSVPIEARAVQNQRGGVLTQRSAAKRN